MTGFWFTTVNHKHNANRRVALYLKDSHSNFEEKRVGNKVSLKVGREVIQNDNFSKCGNYYYYQHILKHTGCPRKNARLCFKASRGSQK